MIWALGQDLVGESQPLLETIGSAMGFTDPTSIDSKISQLADNYELFNNYPNPFNPSTVIKFTLPQSSYVKLIVYNSLGEEIKILVNDYLSEGIHEKVFDTSNLPAGRHGLSSGIYFYTLISGDYVATKKMIFLK
jgi:hypothetical protein